MDIGEFVLPDIASVHPALMRRLIEARMRSALAESGGARLSAAGTGMDTGAIASEIATAVMQSVNSMGGRGNGPPGREVVPP